MEPYSLVYPMFAMVLLSASTLGRLFLGRFRAVRNGTADVRLFKTFQGGGEPTSTTQLSRNFSNLFEAPTLFYAACISAMIVAPDSNFIEALAWVYVVARVIHTWIHTRSNTLNHRLAAYLASWAVLLLLWSAIAFEAATRH